MKLEFNGSVLRCSLANIGIHKNIAFIWVIWVGVTA